MQVTFPGLYKEKTRTGALRYRVRVPKTNQKRITLTVPPDHPDFVEQYHAARAGVPPVEASPQSAIATLLEKPYAEKTIRRCLAGASNQAKARGFEFSIDMEFVKGMVERQKGKCVLSGIEFDLTDDPEGRRRPFSLSIDRIRNNIGYTRHNVRLVCTIVNVGRSDWSDEDYIRACKSVAKNAKGDQ